MQGAKAAEETAAQREVLVAAAKGVVFVLALVESAFARVVVRESSINKEILALTKNVRSVEQP